MQGPSYARLVSGELLPNAVALVVLASALACASEPAPTADKTEAAPVANAERKPRLGPAPRESIAATAKALPAPATVVKPAAVPLPKAEVQIAAADGVTVYADHYPLSEPPSSLSPMILLFHQAGWNASEYNAIAPRLNALGFHVVAPDQRSGGTRGGRSNRTVKALGDSTDFLQAYPDLVATLAWAKQHHKGKLIVWGSSYSAALVFKLAAEHPADIQAVLSFSPGEYIGREGTVAGWAAGVDAPLFATSAPGREVAATAAISAAARSGTKVHHKAAHGVHGSSILREDRNKKGAAPVWEAVEGFLAQVR